MIEIRRSFDPVWRVAAVVAALLILATLLVWLLQKLKPQKNWGELASRTYAWWVMAALVFAAALLPPGGSAVMFGLMSFWALKEFITLLKTRAADHKALVMAFASVPAQYWWVFTAWYGMFIIFIPVYVFLLLPAVRVLARQTAGFITAASQLQWGLMAFVYGLSHLAFLRNLVPDSTCADGRTLLLFLIFTVEFSDVMQYTWGKLLGRRKILPEVSPNKTWAGFLGGTLSASGCSLALRFLTPFSARECFLVALGVTVTGFLGGAVMSAVKRDFGVKDFGELIPGHGGVLDRVDSLCYAAPLFFHYVRYYHHAA